jgi:hypothetical protein
MGDPWAVTAAIPSIPPRAAPGGVLGEAVASVLAQTRPAAALAVSIDHRREGVWVMRQRLLSMVATPWIGWLDDDDVWYPSHLQVALDAAAAHDADYVFTWFDGDRGDHLGHFGKPFDPAAPHHTTMCVVVRAELARQVGFTPPPQRDAQGRPPAHAGEDWRFITGCVAAGAKIIHVPQRTWRYRMDGRNTSGLPWNW